MSKKRAIRILNAHGGSHTSRKQALKYLESGRARYVDETTIRMIEDDPRHLAASPERQMAAAANPPASSSHSPRLEIVARPQAEERPFYAFDMGQTFLPYPQRNMSTPGRLRRAA